MFSHADSLKHIYQELFKTLRLLYDENEARALAFELLDIHVDGARNKVIMNAEHGLKDSEIALLESNLNRVLNAEPIQYIRGFTHFLDLKIYVNEHVLIPRPETEELVDWIVKDGMSYNSAIDIGTGSGCIALALVKNNIPNVAALDISEPALALAQKNAKENDMKIELIEADVLSNPDLDRKFDLIVSNPPYVRKQEMNQMEKNVLEYEPHLALFVEDNDPLVFYKAIIDFSNRHLNSGGMLYFEINEFLGESIKRLLKDQGFEKIELKKDLSGRDRFTRAFNP